MAKPTETLRWAENFNYATGLFPGTPTKLKDPLGQTDGSIPGEGIVAPFYNTNINLLGLYTQWVFDGTDQPDLTAHIVETDGDGYISAAGAFLGNTAASDYALDIRENSGDPTRTISATNSSDGVVLFSSGSNNYAIDASNNSDSAATLRATNNNGSGSANCISAVTSAGIGVRSSSTSGLCFEAITTSGGILSGTTSNALPITIGTSNVNGVAIFAQNTNVASTAASAGFFAGNAGAGPGLRTQSNTGYGLIATSFTPTKSSIQLTPQNTPSSLEAGALWYNTTQEAIGWGHGVGAGDYHYAWGTPGGFVEGFNQDPSERVINAGAGVNDITMSFSTGMEPKTIGWVEITLEFRARAQNFNEDGGQINFRIYDVTGSVEVVQETGLRVNPFRWQSVDRNGGADSDDFYFGWSQVVRTYRYLLPSAGPRQFRFDLLTPVPRDIIIASRTLKVRGLFSSSGQA
jgi:hypothetical protein